MRTQIIVEPSSQVAKEAIRLVISQWEERGGQLHEYVDGEKADAFTLCRDHFDGTVYVGDFGRIEPGDKLLFADRVWIVEDVAYWLNASNGDGWYKEPIQAVTVSLSEDESQRVFDTWVANDAKTNFR